MGKGSGRRPTQISEQEAAANYDRIFRAPKKRGRPKKEPVPLPRCDECKTRHKPGDPCYDFGV